MSKTLKEIIQREFKSHFDGVNELVVVSVRGISGKDNNEMRGDLLNKQIHLRVVKNSLATRVLCEYGMSEIGQLLNGSCAIAYGGDNIVDLAKTLMEWDKKLEHFNVKGGYLEGKLLDAEAAKALSKMPNRVELQGMIVMLANSPGSRLAGAIGSPASNIAGCIKALIEKHEAA